MNNENLKQLVKQLHVAIDIKDKLMEIDLLFKISEIHFNESDFEKAKLNLNRILKINEKEKNVYYYLSLIEIAKNREEKAQYFLNKELKYNPNNKDAKILKQKLVINSNFPLITILLILLNTIVFYFTFPEISLTNQIKFAISLNNFDLSNMISSIFFHSNLLHFLSNMIVLLMFGLVLEKHIGSLKFLTLFLFSAVFGNSIEALGTSNAFVLGASAGIFGIIGGLIMIKPLMNLRVLGFFKIPIILVFGGYFIFSNLISKLTGLQSQMMTGDLAHTIGFLIGILVIGVTYQDTIRIFYNWIAILFGFYLINFSINLTIDNLAIISPVIIQIILYFIIGIFLVFYSYSSLKIFKMVRGEEE